MTLFHYMFIIIAILVQIIGLIGFTLKKINIKPYAYGYTIVSVLCFVFGILPLVFPNYSLARQIFTVIALTFGAIIITYEVLRLTHNG